MPDATRPMMAIRSPGLIDRLMSLRLSTLAAGYRKQMPFRSIWPVRISGTMLRAATWRSSVASIMRCSEASVVIDWRARVTRNANCPIGDMARPASMTIAMIAPIVMVPSLNK